MAELITIARPYAQAVFERAQANNGFAQWSEMLTTAAAVASNPTMQQLIAGTKLGKKQVADLFIDVCGDALNEEGRNLIRLLAENRRLNVLPDLAVLYEEMRREAEKTIEAEMFSAKPVDEAQQAKIASALEKRLGRKVSLKVTTDESLLGGAIIRAGDMIIDGSVKGRLSKLASAMNH